MCQINDMINEIHFTTQIVRVTATSHFAEILSLPYSPELSLVHIDVVWFGLVSYPFYRLGLPSVNSSCIIYFYDFQSIFCASIIQLCYNLKNKSNIVCALTACNCFTLTAPLICVSFFFLFFPHTCIIRLWAAVNFI